MFRQTSTALASKTTRGTTRYQARPPARKFKQFMSYINHPVSDREVLKEQRCSFHHVYYTREPEWHAGRNVKMHNKTYTLTATTPGVLQIEKSAINPAYKWVHIDPDIQKVHRSNELRKHLSRSGKQSELSRKNATFLESNEMKDFDEPRWRERVMAVPKSQQRFRDPNLIARGLEMSVVEEEQFCYE